MEDGFLIPGKINIAKNASIDSLINGVFDGKYEDCLVNDLSDKKDLILLLAFMIWQKYSHLYSVEATYALGFRSKRIEIAVQIGNKIILCKVVKNKNKLDKEAMDLDVVAMDIKKKQSSVTPVICLFVNSGECVGIAKNLQKYIGSELVLIDINHILNFKNKEGILDLNLLK